MDVLLHRKRTPRVVKRGIVGRILTATVVMVRELLEMVSLVVWYLERPAEACSHAAQLSFHVIHYIRGSRPTTLFWRT